MHFHKIKIITLAVFTVVLFALSVPAWGAVPKKPGPATRKPSGVLKIGIIDFSRIMGESQAAKAARETLGKEVEAKKAELAAKEKESQQLEQKIRREGPSWKPEVRKQNEEKLAQELKELKRVRADQDEELRKKDFELAQKIYREVMEIAAGYAKKENLSFIMERRAVLLVNDASLDITGEILKLYDAKKQ